jgi:hypothetical protein
MLRVRTLALPSEVDTLEAALKAHGATADTADAADAADAAFVQLREAVDRRVSAMPSAQRKLLLKQSKLHVGAELSGKAVTDEQVQ